MQRENEAKKKRGRRKIREQETGTVKLTLIEKSN